MTYPEYLASAAWEQKRLEALDRAAYKCQTCARTLSLNVHHNDYARIFNELPTDLVVLCRKCHMHFHGILPTFGGRKARKPREPRPVRMSRKAARRAAKRLAKSAVVNPPVIPQSEGDVIVSKKFIDSLRPTRQCMALFGLRYPLISGWAKRLAGTRITEEKLQSLLKYARDPAKSELHVTRCHHELPR